jgi:hypothetical protein
LALIDEAVATVRDTGERWYDAELCRPRGELLGPRQHASQPSSSGANPEAERSFRDALHIARRQRARSLELRAAVRLAALPFAGRAAGARAPGAGRDLRLLRRLGRHG